MREVEAVLVDLDGTLLDTAGDLAEAANRMLTALGLPRRSVQEIANYVGQGITRLVERSLTGDLERRASPELLQRAFAMFAPAYEEISGRHSRLYPGVLEGLQAFAEQRMRLACVTNKAERFTMPLLERFGLGPRFEVIVTGDQVARGKPDPLPYLAACERLAVAPRSALVVGDSQNDVAAARAAGMRVVCVPYGYNEARPTQTLGADAIVPTLLGAARHAAALNGGG